MPSASHASRSDGGGSCLPTNPPFAPDGTITAFFTCWAFTRPRIELDHQVRLGLAALPLLVVVSAQRRLDERQVGAEDAVIVKARHLIEKACDFLGDRVAALGFSAAGQRAVS